ncbi:MAG TPA: cyclophilin-like fold protein [bacterium]|nr:cyclophilin-like fold protein [bacterium]
MDREIVLKTGKTVMKGEILDTRLGAKICGAMPLEARANTWGMEIYFEIPLKSGIDKPVGIVEKGDIAYWPQGRCLCFFFGPTPMSTGEKPVPASDVEVVGRITSDLKELEKVRAGEEITLELSSPTS